MKGSPAKAHILSLETPPLRDGRHKRFLINSKIYTWQEITEFLRKARPELKGRLPKETDTPPRMMNAPLDLSFTEDALGLKEYIPWTETVLENIDQVLRWEETVLNSDT